MCAKRLGCTLQSCFRAVPVEREREGKRETERERERESRAEQSISGLSQSAYRKHAKEHKQAQATEASLFSWWLISAKAS